MSINVCIICNERENISIMKIFSSSTRCCVFYQVLVMGICRYSGQSENARKKLKTNENPASATHFPSLTFLDNYLSTSASIDWKWNVVQGKWYSTNKVFWLVITVTTNSLLVDCRMMKPIRKSFTSLTLMLAVNLFSKHTDAKITQLDEMQLNKFIKNIFRAWISRSRDPSCFMEVGGVWRQVLDDADAHSECHC